MSRPRPKGHFISLQGRLTGLPLKKALNIFPCITCTTAAQAGMLSDRLFCFPVVIPPRSLPEAKAFSLPPNRAGACLGRKTKRTALTNGPFCYGKENSEDSNSTSKDLFDTLSITAGVQNIQCFSCKLACHI